MSRYRTLDPATGTTVAEYAPSSDREVAAALDDAHREHHDWRERPIAERAAILHRVAELYRERSDALADIIAREMGKPLAEGAGEVRLVADIFDYYADHAEGFLAEEELETSGVGRAILRTEPIGAILGIMPWNYPYYQVARLAAPNLALGNTVVLKHASNCPASALAIAEIFTDAGLPAGAYRPIFASPEQISALIADPRLRGVSLTGSERAGALVAEQAGRHLTKCVLELGGSDPFIVLGSRDLDRVVRQAVAGRMSNAGQACTAAKRMIVVDALYEEFTAKLVQAVSEIVPGDPRADGARMGPLSSQAAVEELVEQIDDARAAGAQVLVGGAAIAGAGAFLQPTVLVDVPESARAYREELFGPVAVVYRVADAAAAVTLANDSPFGLGGCVFSDDPELAAWVADRLDVGMVTINGISTSRPELPFGGVKASGFGRELGVFGVHEFANRKLVRTIR